MDVFSDLLFDYTLRTVALGSAALGVVSGAVGAFAMLRRQALLGDAMSHAALPGVALAFLITGSRTPLVLMIGAALAGWVAALAVIGIVRASRVKADAAMALILSVFFGAGLVVLTFIQRQPAAGKAGLDRYLFGQAAALLEIDVITMASVGAVAVLTLLVLWKEFKLLSFNPDFAASLGYPVRRLDVLLTSLLVIAIVVGLKTVGVVLMSAMVVAPGAAARQWTDRLGVMVILSAVLGAAAGVAGSVISTTAHTATGPTIVLVATGIVAVSLLFAPRRGVAWARFRAWRRRRLLALEAVLGDLAALSAQHARDPGHAHHVAALYAIRGRAVVDRALAELAAQGLARRTSGDAWTLTDLGRDRASRAARLRATQAGAP